MYTFILLLLMISSQAIAQTGTTVPDTTPPKAETLSATESPACPTCPKCESCARGKTEGYRADSFGTVMVGYQYANNWVPRKTTGSYTQILNREWSMEFEYATSQRNVTLAGIDVGEMREDRYTLLGKYYVGNSFHVSFGGYMSELKLTGSGHFGNNTKSTSELENYGLAAAFGSRWQNKWGLTWGVDWFRVNVPVKDGKIQKRDGDLNNDGQQDLNRSFRFLRTFPTFTFVGVSVGYTF